MSISFDREADHEVLRTAQWLPRTPDEIWPFFSSAENLQRITPPWLDFKVVTPTPIEMGEGTLIDYKLKVHGLPIQWRSIIRDWDPPRQFVDEQLKGPYRLWHHTHVFEPKDDGTLARDVVRFRVPGGRLMSAIFVRRDLEKIFTYRQQVLEQMFGERCGDATSTKGE